MAAKRILLWLLIITLVTQYGYIQSLKIGYDGCMEQTTDADACIVVIQCTRNLNRFDNAVSNKNCIRRNLYSDYYSRQSIRDDYQLLTFFDDMAEDTSWNILQSYTSHINAFHLTGGNLTSIPSVVNYMQNIKEFESKNNKIETIVLKNFLNKPKMTKMILSHNAITTIDTEDIELDLMERLDSLLTLDLSYNLIEVLPKNGFTFFRNLDNLDLSHNNIKTLDIYTFEGMSNLNTLILSYNKITTIGHSFVRFVNLKYLLIDHNNITKLLESNVISMVKLEKIDISYNQIEHIEDDAFKSLHRLQHLNISHNRIKVIKETLFKNTTNLDTLKLADNEIGLIEPGAFEEAKITDFSIENNCIAGTITINTFKGVKVSNLTLNNGKIQSLGDNAFSSLTANLILLNLSTNSINNISKSAFRSLNLLTILDLSNNNISELNFDTSDLKNLSLFYVRNNTISKIYNSVFCHLSSLVELDLSNNIIKEIELNSFDLLSNLKKLLLKDNDLTNSINSYTFCRLISVYRIDFTNTKIHNYNNETFSNMTSLTKFISSNGQLTNVAYNAFLGTGSINYMDLSYNLLDNFSLNTTTIKQVKKLYLNNNRLTKIINSTFFGLESLQTLNLSLNNIFSVDFKSFQSLSSLVSVDLSFNSDVDLASNIFDNLTWLEYVSLSNIRKQFNFLNATNTSISNLLLSKHHIDNINDIFVFHVNNICKLDLSANKITYIDKYSFQIMESLTWLDLSCNMITEIQPGSFSHMHMINKLNLHDNEIQSLQYGVLDGLINLRTLNLSNNALQRFEANVLHTAPLLEIISLDNNVIRSLQFHTFFKTNVKLMYLGGNQILCSVLVDLKDVRNKTGFSITAENLDYSSENVNGITCKTSIKDVLNNVYNNSGSNITFIFRELAKSVVDLQETLKNIANKTAIKEDVLKSSLTDVAKSVDILATSYNKSQVASENNLKMFLRVLNESDYRNHGNTVDTNLANEKNVVPKGILKDIFMHMEHGSKKDEGNQNDVILSLLYVITVCFIVMLVSVMGLIVYILKKTKMQLISSYSTQPILRNSIEMD